MPRTGERRQEQAFATEQDVLEATDHLNVEADAGLEHADMAGVDEQPFARREIAFDQFAGEIEPNNSRPRDLLQNEALAAEETGAEPFLPGEFERDRFLRDEEALLPADQRLAGLQQRRHDRAGKARREGDMAGTVGGEVGDEERAAAERALQPGEQAAAR